MTHVDDRHPEPIDEVEPSLGLSRRGLLGSGLAASGAVFLAPFTSGGVAAAGAAVPATGASSGGYLGGSSALGFAGRSPVDVG